MIALALTLVIVVTLGGLIWRRKSLEDDRESDARARRGRARVRRARRGTS